MADIRSTTKVEGSDAHDAASTQNPVLVGFEAKDQDGAALPNAVSAEGDVVRPAASLSGVQYVMPVSENGAAALLPSALSADRLKVALVDAGGADITGGSADGLEVQGPAASDAPVAGAPLLTGGRASDTLVSPVSTDGDAVALWLSKRGSVYTGAIPHAAVDGSPYTLVNKTLQPGGAQTGTAIWTPAGGKRIVVLSYDLTISGTAATDATLWFGAGGDTTWTLSTDYAVFHGTFAPSATFPPGISRSGLWISDAADRVLRLTAGGANTYYVSVWGYEI